MIILTAANPGSKPVTLNTPSIQLPNGIKLFDLHPAAEVKFPHELTEGKSCMVWFPAKGIAQTLAENGFAGKVSIAGEFSDAVGTFYRSKLFKFDVTKWVKG